MSTPTKDQTSTPGEAGSGSWFRMRNRQMWHAEANREYGVVWSRCGMRALFADTVAQEKLEEKDTVCVRCTGQRR